MEHELQDARSGPQCPRCGERLTTLQADGTGAGDPEVRSYRCEHCGWLGDEEDRETER
jgi:DNA-directed RNA polymerase subunit M/transcription elongation factor TFIIS